MDAHKVPTFSPKETSRYRPDGCRDTARGGSSKKLISSEDLSWKFQTRRALSMPTVATFRQYHTVTQLNNGQVSKHQPNNRRGLCPAATVPKLMEKCCHIISSLFRPLSGMLHTQSITASTSILTRGFQTATETPVMREEGTPVVPPPGRAGAVGIGNGPAILSKFMVSSFKMSVFDKARLPHGMTIRQHDNMVGWDEMDSRC